MAEDLNILAEQSGIPSMQMEPPYMDVCSQEFEPSDKICNQYGVSQDMGGWSVNYTIAAYYPESLKNNTLFNQYFIDDNGASVVQSGFNNWIDKDPDGTFISYLSENQKIIQDKSCDDFTLKVIARSSMISDTEFKYGNGHDGFLGRFNYLCDLAKGNDPDSGGGSTDYTYLWYVGAAAIAVIGVVACFMKKHTTGVGEYRTPLVASGNNNGYIRQT